MNIQSLPPEILLKIGSYLDKPDWLKLKKCSRYFYSTFSEKNWRKFPFVCQRCRIKTFFNEPSPSAARRILELTKAVKARDYGVMDFRFFRIKDIDFKKDCNELSKNCRRCKIQFVIALDSPDDDPVKSRPRPNFKPTDKNIKVVLQHYFYPEKEFDPELFDSELESFKNRPRD